MAIVRGRSRIIERVAPSSLATSYSDAAEAIQHVIVRLEDESGIVGIGEATAVPEFTGETTLQIDQYLKKFVLPQTIGISPFDTSAWHAGFGRTAGHSGARAALDIAMYDLQAKLVGQPLYNLLGGKMRDRVALSFPIGICPVDVAVESATKAVNRGLKTLKLKIGRDEQADIARLAAVRLAVGPNINIRVDANSIYSVSDAVRIVSRLAQYDLQLVEQPVQVSDVPGMATVRDKTGVPVMIDEGLRSLQDMLEVIRYQAVDHIAIKLISVGGIYQALPMIHLAAMYGLGVVVSSPSDTQVGAAAVLALALAAPTGNLAHEMRVFDSQSELAESDIVASEGFVYPSSMPGHGVSSIPELVDFFG